MGGRIVLIALVCVAIAFAPAATAEPQSGSCVWTSSNGTQVSVGYDLRECTGRGGLYLGPEPEKG